LITETSTLSWKGSSGEIDLKRLLLMKKKKMGGMLLKGRLLFLYLHLKTTSLSLKVLEQSMSKSKRRSKRCCSI